MAVIALVSLYVSSKAVSLSGCGKGVNLPMECMYHLKPS